MHKISSTVDSKRFSLSNFIPYEVGLGYDSLNSEFRRRLVQLPVAGRFIVSAKDEFRADLMAHNLYGDTSYWWILLDYNNLDSPEQLVVGTSLSYPSIDSLTNLFALLKESGSILVDDSIPEDLHPVGLSYLGIDEPRGDTIYFSITDSKFVKVFLDPVSVSKEVSYRITGKDSEHFMVDFVDTIDGEDYFRVYPKERNLPIEGGEPTVAKEAVLEFSLGDLSTSVSLVHFGESDSELSIYERDGVRTLNLSSLEQEVFINMVPEVIEISDDDSDFFWGTCSPVLGEAGKYVIRVKENKTNFVRAHTITLIDGKGGNWSIVVQQDHMEQEEPEPETPTSDVS